MRTSSTSRQVWALIKVYLIICGWGRARNGWSRTSLQNHPRWTILQVSNKVQICLLKAQLLVSDSSTNTLQGKYHRNQFKLSNYMNNTTRPALVGGLWMTRTSFHTPSKHLKTSCMITGCLWHQKWWKNKVAKKRVWILKHRLIGSKFLSRHLDRLAKNPYREKCHSQVTNFNPSGSPDRKSCATLEKNKTRSECKLVLTFLGEEPNR